MNGIQIFGTAQEAIRAGYQILSSIPERDGFLSARTRTPGGWALALVRMR